MKKVMIALAAVAMVAFAGCKKDNNTVAFHVGFEDTPNKEAWYNFGNQVVFEQGDGVIVNGVEYQLELIPEAITGYSQSYSRDAIVRMCPDVLGRTAEMLYPANDFIADSNHGFRFTIFNDITMPEANLPEGAMYTLANGGNYWPLVAYLPNVEGNNTFYLKNTTALIAPAVKWGPNFIEDFNEKYHTNYPLSTTNIRINDIWLSASQPLAGTGYVANIPSAGSANVNCLFTIDPAYGDASYDIHAAPMYDVNADYYTWSDNVNIIGNIAVPVLTSGIISMTIAFDILDANGNVLKSMEYHSDNLNIGSDIVLARSQRTTLCANFYQHRTDWTGFTEL